MIVIDAESLTDRFMRYVRVDTQSDPHSETFPTTAKQKQLSAILVTELKNAGLDDAAMDEFGYVYASIPSNVEKDVPAICFCSHVDTAPDCSGSNVKPSLHKKYDGNDIVLPDDTTQVLKLSEHPYLLEHIGEDIITASGNTLLGADDKSGVAIIIEAASWLVRNPDVKHGPIKIVFTPDEEVGKGTAKIDLQKLNAKFAYTLDGGEAGSLEDENFNADGATVIIHGVIAHPGYAKDKLVNALKIAGEILQKLPKHLSPEHTEGKEGFIHPVHVSGIAEKAMIDFILRDFNLNKLDQHRNVLQTLVNDVVKEFPGATADVTISEQYRNMKEVLQHHPEVVDYANEAIKRAGLKPKTESIRGGTDGARLSHMGLPCPNIFTGMQGIHSKQEWIGVKDMVKATETIIHLCMIWEEKT
jgi:tripeptide aminopeptidase